MLLKTKYLYLYKYLVFNKLFFLLTNYFLLLKIKYLYIYKYLVFSCFILFFVYLYFYICALY